MKLFNRILCPVDFSQHSVKSLHWTEYLAKQHGAEVIILHVMERLPSTVDIGIDYDEYRDKILRDLKAFLSPLTIPYRHILSSGTPSEKITNLASTLDCTLIAMSTRGLSGIAHRLIGSSAESVIRHSPVPVMTFSPFCVLPNSSVQERALIPISDLNLATKDCIRLRKIVRDLGVYITMMHVIDMKDEMFDSSFHANPYLVTNCQLSEKATSLQAIGMQIDKNCESVGTVVQFGKSSKEILKEAETGYGWIVMTSKRQKLLFRFLGSTTYDVISHATTPVITVGVK